MFILFFFQSNAELAVRDMLRDFARRRRQQTGSLEVESEDFMDDGTPISLRVQINEQEVNCGIFVIMNVPTKRLSTPVEPKSLFIIICIIYLYH